MKEKKKRRHLSSLLVLLLVGLMGAGSVCSGFLGFSKSGIPGGGIVSSAQPYILEHQTGVDGSKYLNQDLALDKELADGILDADDDIHLIIEVSETSLFTLYDATSKSMTYQEFLATRGARLNAENMYARQREIFKQISKKVDAKFLHSYTGLVNGFSIGIKYGDRALVDEVGYRAGILSSSVSEVYAKPEVETADNEIDCEETGIFTNTSEYQGEGMLVAVLDSGLDYTHPAFDERNLPQKEVIQDGQTVKVVDEDALALTRADLEAMWNDGVKLSAGTYSAAGQLLATNNLTVSDVYMSAKVPFAYDYADWDTDVNTPEDGMHGTHVTGIIVGQTLEEDILYRKKDGLNEDGTQKYILVETYSAADLTNNLIELDKNGNPKQYIKSKTKNASGEIVADASNIRVDDFGRDMLAIKGVAPKAQVIGLKVFSDLNSGGSQEDTLLAALQDSSAFGVDVINMSLGSASGFSDLADLPTMQKAYERIHDLGINLIVAAGNNASSARGGSFGTNLTSNPDSGTIGSPASLNQSFAVASIQGVKSKYIAVKNAQDTQVTVSYFTEAGKTNGDKYDFIKDLGVAISGTNYYGLDYKDQTFTVGSKTYNYYTADELGTDGVRRGEVYRIPYVVIPGLGRETDFETSDVQGKIALIQRGKLTFTDKILYAKQAGAIAAVIYNNVAGIISMAIEESEDAKNHLPACSVTMDSAAKYKNLSGGYFEIAETQAAGPFMSDFSSWGPLPDLQLKPEITGHGGEIYSASPGNNYARISGTSMASPNIAGLTVAMRQYLKTEIEKDDGGKFGDMTTAEMRSLIYKIMMSTAISPVDEDENPYAPRRVGAGVADLKKMLETDAYIYIDDTKKEYEFNADGTRTGEFELIPVTDKSGNKLIKESTKIELYDDPTRTGVYDMDFYVKNVGSTDLHYGLDANVMTETMSSDRTYTTKDGQRVVEFEGTVAEKTRLLTDATKEFSRVTGTDTAPVYTPIADKNITVPANSTVKIRLTVKLTQDDKDYIDEHFTNGMYVEGFIMLTDKDNADEDDKINLNVPYLAYYGDWTEPPMLSYSVFETDPDDKDDNIYDKDKRRTQSEPLMAFGKYTLNGNHYTYPIGSYLWIHSDIFEGSVPVAKEDKASISLSPEAIYELYYLAGLQRPFKTFSYEIRDVVTGELMHSDLRFNARKSGVRLDLSPAAIGCKNGGTYRFEMTGHLDYLDGKQGKNNSWGFDFTINTSPPVLTDCEVRYEKRTSGTYGFDRYLDFYISSDHYVSAMSFWLWNKKSQRYENLYDKGMRPIDGGKNTVTRVSFALNEFLWNEIKENDYLIQIEIFDWAVNSSYYRLDLRSLGTAAQQIDLADIGIYQEYSSGDDTISVLTDYIKDISYDAMGNYKSFAPEGGFIYDRDNNVTNPKTVYMLPNQNIELKYAVVATENFWEEDLAWSSTDKNVVSINSKTGEICARTAGTSKITVMSKETGREAVFIAEVLSAEQCEEYNIPFYQKNSDNTPTAPSGKKPNTLKFTEDILNYYSTPDSIFYLLDPGERYEVEVEFDPWFTKENILKSDGNKITDEEWAERIQWSSHNPNAIVIDPGVNKYGLKVDDKDSTKKVSPFTATLIAARGTFDQNGYYVPPAGVGSGTAITARVNISVTNEPEYVQKTIYFGLRPEFVVENSVLTKYYGDNQDYMPDSVKKYITNYKNYPGTDNVAKESQMISNYQDIITNTESEGVKALIEQSNGTFNLFPYDPKSYPQLTYDNADPIWEGIQLKIKDEDGNDADMPNGTKVDDIFKYKRLFSNVSLSNFIDKYGQILTRYDLCFKNYTYYQGYLQIPTNLNIKLIGETIFMGNQHITKLIFPEGIQRIQRGACAEMTALREVYFPSTLKAIEDWGFPAKNDPVLGATTSLHIVDTSKVIEPIAIGYGGFQNQQILGIRNLIVKDGDFYVDDGGTYKYETSKEDIIPIPYQYYRYSPESGVYPAGTDADSAKDYLLKDAAGNPRYFDKVFDLSVVKSVGQQAFYNLTNVKYVDISNITVMGPIAFAYFGSSVGWPTRLENAKDGDPRVSMHKVAIKTGTNTFLSLAAFTGSGINLPLVLNMRRIPIQAFYASISIPSLTFTRDDVVIDEGAFAITPLLEEIDFQGSVESIGVGAFAAAILTSTGGSKHSISALTKISWNTVKRIEESAFYDAVALIDITLPNGLEYVGQDAFALNPDSLSNDPAVKVSYNQWDILTGKLPLQARKDESGQYIDKNGQPTTNINNYDYLKGIRTLRIPANFDSDVSLILPFTNAVEFAEIIVETEIGITPKYEVDNNILLKISGDNREIVLIPYGVTSITVPANLTKINAYAFANSALETIDLSDCTNLVIGEGAFMNCQSLTDVSLPDSMTIIPDYLFADCMNLTNIQWNQDDVTQIGVAAFRNTGLSGFISTPDLTEMGAEAFKGTNITGFDFDSATGLTYVANGAFSRCEEIRGEIVLPAHITEIHANAFATVNPYGELRKTSYITGITAEGVTFIGDSAFENCNRLAYAVFPKVKTIGNYAFAANGLTTTNPAPTKQNPESTVRGLDIRNVEKIGFGAFSGQTNLTQFGQTKLTRKEEAVGAGATATIKVTIDETIIRQNELTKLTNIGAYAFANTSINSFDKAFPKVESIGAYAFLQNRALVSVNIPASVKTIGEAPFAGATKLTSFTVDANNKNFTAIEGVLFKKVNDGLIVEYNDGGTAVGSELGAEALELIQYPSGGYRQWIEYVTENKKVTEKTVTERSKFYTVPEGTVSINHRAFYLNTYLSHVTLPSTLKTIGDGAFFNSEIRSYKFMSLYAPILESWVSGLTKEQTGDEYGQYWGVYSNFVGYFNLTTSMLIREQVIRDDDTFDEDEEVIIGADESQYMYNGITPSYFNDQFVLIDKDNIHGGGFTGTDFGLTIEFPGNGMGYNSFVYSHYFTRRIVGADILLPKTQEVIDTIATLAGYDNAKLTTLLNNLIAAKNTLIATQEELAAATAAYNKAIGTDEADAKKAIRDEVQGRLNVATTKLEEAQTAADVIPSTRGMYSILSQGQQELVHNYSVLLAAEDRYYKIFAGVKYSITYMNGSKVFDRKDVENGVRAVRPTNVPELKWFVFAGWYLEDELYDFSTPVKGPLVLNARFTHNGTTFTVKFDDSSLDDATVLGGETLNKPQDPTKKKYVFKGWFVGDEEYDFSTPVTGDITLTAKWEKDKKCGGCGTISVDSGAGMMVALLTLISIAAAASFIILKKRGKNK